MANLVPFPRMQFLDANGNPLAGGKLYTYVSGTSTPLPTYTDAGAGTPNANPVILDSGGWGNIWCSSALYRFTLTDSTGALIWGPIDNINNPDLSTLSTLAASGGSALIGHTPSGSGATQTTVYQMFENDPISIFRFMSETQRNDVQSGSASVDVSTAVQKAFDIAYGAGSVVRAVTGWGKAKLLSTVTLRTSILGLGAAALNGKGLTFSWQGSGAKVFDVPVYDSGWVFFNFRIDSQTVTSDVYHMYCDTGLNGALFMNVEFRGYHTGSFWGGTYANHDALSAVGGSGATKYDFSNNTFLNCQFNRTRTGVVVLNDPAAGGPGNTCRFIQCFSLCNGPSVKLWGSSNSFDTFEANTEAGSHTFYMAGGFAANWSFGGCEMQTADSGVGNEPLYADTVGAAMLATFKGGSLLQSAGGGFPALVLDAGATGGKKYRYSTENVNNVNISTDLTIDRVALGRGVVFYNGGLMSGEWTTPAFFAGNFTGNGAMTVTVLAGQVATYEYFYSGKMMTVNFTINNFTIAGTPNTQVKIAIPNSSVSAKQTVNPVLVKDNGTWRIGFADVEAAGTTILIFADPTGGTNWTASATNSAIQGSITFEIQ